MHVRTGLIRAITRHPGDPGTFTIPLFTAHVSQHVPARLAGAADPARAQDLLGTGTALDPRVARARAIGEAVERYALVTTAHLRPVWGAWQDVADAAVHPEALAPLTDAERARFPDLARFDPERVRAWTRVTDLVHGEPRLVPAEFLHRSPVRGGTDTLTPLLPSGSACGWDLTEATRRALSEAVERDALMLFWARQRRLPRVRPDSVEGADFHHIVAGVTASGPEFILLDMTSDVAYPAYAAVIVDRSGEGPALTMGTGAAFDPEAAVLRAAEEAVHMRTRARHLHRRAATAGRASPYPWHDVSMLSRADFILHHHAETPLRAPTPLRSEKDGVDRLVALMAKAGAHPFAAEITPPDVASLGLRVAAVVVQGLLPKTFTPGLWHAGTERLFAPLPGDARAPRAEADLSDLPIPYP